MYLQAARRCQAVVASQTECVLLLCTMLVVFLLLPQVWVVKTAMAGKRARDTDSPHQHMRAAPKKARMQATSV